MQKDFFKISAGNFLPALRFQGGLYNLGNYNFLQLPSKIFYRFGNDQILPKTCAAETASLKKIKNYIKNYDIRYNTLKNHFLWFLLG